MKYFKTKHNYHDADILGYSWKGTDLALELRPIYKADIPSTVWFIDVQNRDEVTKKLDESLKFRGGNTNICSIERKSKNNFIVHISDPLNIFCQDILEI